MLSVVCLLKKVAFPVVGSVTFSQGGKKKTRHSLDTSTQRKQKEGILLHNCSSSFLFPITDIPSKALTEYWVNFHNLIWTM